MVKKLINILKGWYYRFFNKNEELAIKRIAICNKCSHKLHLDMIGDVCDECGCVLEAKARVLDEQCDLNKWYKV